MQKLSSTPKWRTNVYFRLLIIILVLGIFFRFFNIEKKIYWIDEAYTSLWLSGYTEAEMRQQFSEGNILHNEDMQKYKQINPEKGLFDTVKGLAAEDPQHPPAYYLLLRFWMQWFGNSVGAIRSLSAIISLLVFPCVYWLCMELFQSQPVAWVSMALLAISPFHVLYAQEAREYSLWIVTILLSSAVLLWATRTKTKISWLAYAATVIFGFYTYIFTALVLMSHGLYVIVNERFKLTNTVKNYLIASVVSLLAFIPWSWVVFTNLKRIQDTTSWSKETTTPLRLITRWAGNLSRLFLDLGFDASDSISKTAFLIPPIIIILFLVGYSLYFLFKTTPKRVWLFVFTLVGGTAIVLMIPDLILGGRRSGTARYLIPCYLGIQITVAYLLATKIIPRSKKTRQQQLWQSIAIALVLSGILSCAISSQAEEWWNKGSVGYPAIPKIARIVNQANQPLFSIEDRILSVLRSFSYQLEPNVGLNLVKTPHQSNQPEKFGDVFFYRPSQALRDNLEKDRHYVLKPTENLGKFKDQLLLIDDRMKNRS